VPVAAQLKIAIAGLGAMGSAAAFHLARRGHKVAGFDRFSPPHQLASSAGQTRIIREAYYEHPQYVPLIQRAYACWDELEKISGEPLFVKTGGLMIGAPDGPLVTGARASAEKYHLPVEDLSASEIVRRFPAFRPEPQMSGVFEPRAGLLYADRCIRAHLALARDAGAELHSDEPVSSWRVDATGVSVATAEGTYGADRLILSAGAWMPSLLDGFAMPLEIERTVQHWFSAAAHADRFQADRFPVYLFEYAQPNLLFYGFPDTGDGIKIARHHQGRPTTADGLERNVTEDEIEGMRSLMARYLPDANGTHLRSAACMYTDTPDRDFVIDRHPASSRVLVASPCSGHGFKFASAIGEALADLALEQPTRCDLTPFSIARFV
jgi:sarcosine oxidase